MKRTGIIYILIISAFLFNSCKYEDGPFISFYTKVSRIEGYWKFDDVTIDGVSIKSDYEDQIIQFMKSEKCIWFLDINESNMYNLDPDYTEVGFWSLQDNKEELFLDFVTEGHEPFSLTWTILQLKFHEMKLERYENDQRIVWELSKLD